MAEEKPEMDKKEMSSSAWWQQRRAQLLQAACNWISEQIQGGIRSGRAIKKAALKFRQRSLGNGHHLRLSEKTMQRSWYAWRNHHDPSVFLLRYKSGIPRIVVDSSALRLVIETCLRSGQSIAEVLRARPLVSQDGRALSINACYRQLRYRQLSARTIAKFARLQRHITREQANLEIKRRQFVESLSINVSNQACEVE
jgi:hypothetical protein